MHDSEPRFDLSVVIPARNEASFVGQALASVATQLWPLDRLEAVVVDNGSVDGTSEAVTRFTAQHPELAMRSMVELRPGTACARNTGARIAQGRVLLFLDADSRMAPDLARIVLAASETHQAGSIRIIADGDNRLDHAFFDLLEFGKVLFHIRAQMFYCERELFLSHGGFNAELMVAEDKDFLSRLQNARVDVCHLSSSWIATSTRRLHAAPLRLGMIATFSRWAAAQAGIGRRWRY